MEGRLKIALVWDDVAPPCGHRVLRSADLIAEDVYSDGSLVFYGGGFYWGLDYDNFSLLLSNSWTVQQRDAAFTANFSGDVVPEPATGLLSGVALAVLFLVRRRAA